MKKSFIHGFEYNDWANRQIIAYLTEIKDFPDRCVDLMAHIIAVQDYWFDRQVNKSIYLIDLWEKYSLLELNHLNQASTSMWVEYIEKTKEKDFKELCGYYNEEGVALDISAGDIINHILNHSAYHRGQINFLLKNSEIPPVNVDFNQYASF
ncbi:MAG: DinB family protein [Rhodothermaceae bacterium]